MGGSLVTTLTPLSRCVAHTFLLTPLLASVYVHASLLLCREDVLSRLTHGEVGLGKWPICRRLWVYCALFSCVGMVTGRFVFAVTLWEYF